MKRDVLDLRFIIGLFFGLIGMILVLGSFWLQTDGEKSETTNFWSGMTYIGFGVLMIVLWFFGKTQTEE